MSVVRTLAVLLAHLFFASFASAHPVPKDSHDRTVSVRLVPGKEPGQLTVRVDYRLEVDELTVTLDDMAPFFDEIDPARFRGKPLEYYAEFMRIYAPILARHLSAKIDGAESTFTGVPKPPTLVDEQGQALGHLRCDFVFEAANRHPFKGPFRFEFREGTFLLQEGEVRLSLLQDGPWFFDVQQVPDKALQERPALERKPGDDDRLREIRANVSYFPARYEPPAPTTPTTPVEVAPEPPAVPPAIESQSLLRLLQTQPGGFLIVMMFAFLFGAAHALTPGHGKTLVAAYLVGQRGTVMHALLLGVVTTLTHTGGVLLLAAVIHAFGLSPAARTWIQTSLPLVLGLMIACFGFFLLLQRLAGRADHVHVGGGHHHHHHGGHSHTHAPSPAPEGAEAVTWFGLVLLGITGGIIPCWDAIVMLVWAIGMDLLSWALPMLLAFSAGLASVLVLLGILVVKVRRFADSRWGGGAWVRKLPLFSAIAIILLGFWLCYEAVHSPHG